MSHPLPLPHHSRSGEIALRSLRPLAVTQDLLLMIPGGPGISGRYLDPFLAKMDLDDSWNMAILDLPGHGLSAKPTADPAIRYPDLLSSIEQVVRALASEHNRVALWGQSLGGRIILDLLSRFGEKIAGAVVTATPIRFEVSPAFQKGLTELQVDFSQITSEASWVKTWKQMLPLYFKRAPLPQEVDVLAQDTCFSSTGTMLEGASLTPDDPPSALPPLLFIQGREDWVVPDRNLEDLRALYPSAQFEILSDAGHFPMLEAEIRVLDLAIPFVSSLPKELG